MNKVLSVIGVLLVIVAIVYFVFPANSLPEWLPGYDPGLSRIHYTHGAASFVAGAGLLAYAWFRGGKK
jgi:hypothetical protein